MRFKSQKSLLNKNSDSLKNSKLLSDIKIKNYKKTLTSKLLTKTKLNHLNKFKLNSTNLKKNYIANFNPQDKKDLVFNLNSSNIKNKSSNKENVEPVNNINNINTEYKENPSNNTLYSKLNKNKNLM